MRILSLSGAAAYILEKNDVIVTCTKVYLRKNLKMFFLYNINSWYIAIRIYNVNGKITII